MSRLRTSSPWTTPTTPLGARILSEEPATVDAVPTMSLAEMEAALADAAPRPVGPLVAAARRRRPSGWRVAAVAAVLVGVVGSGSGLAVGSSRPAQPAPVAAAAGSTGSTGSTGVEPGPGIAAAWGEAVALSAPAAAPEEASSGEAEATLLPTSVVRVHASLVGEGPSTTGGASGEAMGRLAGRMAPASPTLAAAYP